DGGVAIWRFLDLVPRFGNRLRESAAERVVVVCDQYAAHFVLFYFAFRLPTPDFTVELPFLRECASSFGVPAHRNGQRHTNQRAASQGCAQVDLSVVSVNNL